MILGLRGSVHYWVMLAKITVAFGISFFKDQSNLCKNIPQLPQTHKSSFPIFIGNRIHNNNKISIRCILTSHPDSCNFTNFLISKYFFVFYYTIFRLWKFSFKLFFTFINFKFFVYFDDFLVDGLSVVFLGF